MDLGYKVQTINVSKLRKNPDDWHDFTLPPERPEWSAENFDRWPGIAPNGSPESRPAEDQPVPVPGLQHHGSPESQPGNYQVGGSSSSSSGSVAPPAQIASHGSPEPPIPRVRRRRRPPEGAVEQLGQGEAAHLAQDRDNYDKISFDPIVRGKLDLLELFAGSQHLSQEGSRAGLGVGMPIDLRTGFDLHTTEGQNAVLKMVESQRPEIIWMVVVCTPWTSLQTPAIQRKWQLSGRSTCR